MRIKNVLVTGGAGYVGGILIPKLLQKEYRVTVVDWFIFKEDLFKEYYSNSNLTLVKGDIRDKKLLLKYLKNIDAVIHLACISNDPSFEMDAVLGKQVNFDASKNLIDIAKKMGVKRFVYASTSSVYGIKKEKEVIEDLKLEPLTDYSKYKALIEDYLLLKRSRDFTVFILRPATVCGYSPRLRLDLTVNMLTLQALVNKKITVFGGSQTRPNIHIQDMADIYVKSLEYADNKIAGKVSNVGYENYSIMEIAKMISKIIKDNKLEIVVSPSNDKRSYRISSKKIEKELGFKPKRSVEEAILDLKEAYFQGKIPDAMNSSSYYNIRKMKELSGKL